MAVLVVSDTSWAVGLLAAALTVWVVFTARWSR